MISLVRHDVAEMVRIEFFRDAFRPKKGDKQMKWVKDHKVESGLRQMKIAFEVERVEKVNIDRNEGLRRQARLINKLNDDNVLKLGMAMTEPECGIHMPILQKPPHKAKLWVWSGNHRLAAHDLAFPDEQFMEAYTVCISDPVLIDVLPVVVNVWEGEGLTKQERIMNAQRFVQQHSMSAEEAAKLCCIKVEWLYEANRADKIRQLITGIQGVKTNGIAKSTLIRLAPLATNLNVLRQLTKMLCQHEIKGDEANLVIEEVRNGKTENQQLGEIGKWESIFQERIAAEERAKAAKVKAKATVRGVAKNGKAAAHAAPINPLKLNKSVRDGFFRYLTGLSKMLAKYKTMEQLQLTDASDLEVANKNMAFVVQAIIKMQQEVKAGVK